MDNEKIVSEPTETTETTETTEPTELTETTETVPQSRFDEWEDIKSCNQCEHYWNNSCDGVSEGTTRLCREFKVTRRTNLPLKIQEALQGIREAHRRCDDLRKEIRSVRWSMILFEFSVLLYMIANIIARARG